MHRISVTPACWLRALGLALALGSALVFSMANEWIARRGPYRLPDDLDLRLSAFRTFSGYAALAGTALVVQALAESSRAARARRRSARARRRAAGIVRKQD